MFSDDERERRGGEQAGSLKSGVGGGRDLQLGSSFVLTDSTLKAQDLRDILEIDQDLE